MGIIQIDCHQNENLDKTMKKQLFQVTCFLYFLLTIAKQINAQQKIGEMNPNQCSQSLTTREYLVKQGKFQTTNETIPPGCFAQLITELNGDDSVAAVFLNRTQMRGCIDANYPYPGGDEEKIDYQIVSKMENDTFKVRVCQSVEGSLKEFCGKIIIRFVMREYWNEEETLCVLSIEKLGEF